MAALQFFLTFLLLVVPCMSVLKLIAIGNTIDEVVSPIAHKLEGMDQGPLDAVNAKGDPFQFLRPNPDEVQKVVRSFNRALQLLPETVELFHDVDHGYSICNVNEQFNQGICYMESKCSFLGGKAIGRCPHSPTPKDTCCRFHQFCGRKGAETLMYFESESRTVQPAKCSFTVVPRAEVCQMRIDFLELELPDVDKDGNCDPRNQLVIHHPVRSGLTGSSTTTICGNNTGNHVYLPMQKDPITLELFSQKKMDYNIRLIQISCASYFPLMKSLRVPEGCDQFHLQPKGIIQNFNMGSAASSPDYSYSMCFAHNRTHCGLRLDAVEFDIGGDCSTQDGDYLHIPGASETTDRVCGKEFKEVMTRQAPFVITVRSKKGKKKFNFKLNYELVPCSSS